MKVRDLPITAQAIHTATGTLLVRVIQGDFAIGTVTKRFDGWRVIPNTAGRRGGSRKAHPTASAAAKSFWGAEIARAVEAAMIAYNEAPKVSVTLAVPGEERERVLAKFPTVADAESYLANSPNINKEYLHAGLYGIDAPEELINPKESA